MCGRFASTSTPNDLARFFDASTPKVELAKRYNIAPTAAIYAITNEAETGRTIEAMRWGLLPHWAKTQSGKPFFNAKAETIDTKRTFARSFEQRRCLIPVDGFYEWTQNPDRTKQPHYIAHRDHDPLAFAGIWRTWHHPDTTDTLNTCAIITCAPNKTMAPIHNRMPAILPPTTWRQWLNPETGNVDATQMLRPAPDELLTVHQVSTKVNSTRNDKPDLIEPTK